MKTPLAVLVSFVFCALPVAAQKVQVFGGHAERAASTQILFGEGLVGALSIEHGQPVWKDEYDDMLPKLKGRKLRLGKDWWTTMTTSFPLDFGGTAVPAGSYLVGLVCDDDGKFSLALLEASKNLKKGAVPFPMDRDGNMNWKPDFLCPMTLHKDISKEAVEKMTMTFEIDGEKLAGGFTIAWGRHRLTAPVAIKPAKDESKKR